MPAKVKVRIVSARDLPIMDRSSDLADAFAEVKLGNTVYKTDVYKKSLNPVWNSDWYRFEVDDEDLQEETLQLRVMDYDTYTAHDAIGKVNISLNCLLTRDAPSSMKGWFPIYDTMHGIRGEIKIIIKVDFFVDANKFRQSSCGVQFFNTPSVPTCYKSIAFHGFIEELVVNDDPEYQWIDTFRTPRSSNEARQRLFQKLSGELQRKIGIKVLDFGGNAVIGYQQCFDLEGESGIVVRGIGTCVFLKKLFSSSSPGTPTNFSVSPRDSTCTQEQLLLCDLAKSFPPTRQRKRTSSTESDGESPLKDSSGSGDGGSLGGLANFKMPRQPAPKQRNVDEFEFPFFTLTKFPPGFLRQLGGVVSARSVKLLDRINNPEEPETRDSWWSEIRTEIRSHAKAFGCHAVVGYSESSTICDELIVLSATGTAACVNLEMDSKATVRLAKTVGQGSCPSQPDSDSNVGNSGSGPTGSLYLSVTPTDDAIPASRLRDGCSLCHIPYLDQDIPMPVQLTKCFVCKQAKVPDLLFSTIEMPEELHVTGKGCLLQGRVCRGKRKDKGETNAELISNILPFLEYDLHRQLTNKLKLKGMNALFGLQIQVSVGEVMIIAVGTATAVYLSCLPPPPILRVVGKTSTTDEETRLKNIQKKILDVSAKNRTRYELDEIGDPSASLANLQGLLVEPMSDENHEDKACLDPSSGSREAFVVEIDDKQDEDVITFLFDTPIPEGFYCGTTDVIPGITQAECRMQMITAVKRIALYDNASEQNKVITKLFDNIIKSFCFKLRRLSPCSISNIRFDLEIPMADSVQVAVNAYVVSLQKQHTPGSLSQGNRDDLKESKKGPGILRIGKVESTDCEDLQFQIDEVSLGKPQESSGNSGSSQLRLENKMKLKLPLLPFRPKVEITPMFCVPGSNTERYLGNINLFFIRESLSVRENGGLNSFIQVFIGEVHAVLRAHVLALGGNALISFRMNKVVLLDSPHKNQGQILLNVCGDVVDVSSKDEHLPCFESRTTRSMSCCEETMEKITFRQRTLSANDPLL